MPSITEMLFALDLGDRVVGVTTNCNYPPEAKKKEKIGGFFLNLEKVVSLKPDLVIMLEEAQKRDIEKFKNYGLPVQTIDPKRVSEVMDCLLRIGEVTGTKRKAERLVAGMKRRLSAIQAKGRELKKCPKILVIVGDKPLIVVGGGTFIDDIIECAGGQNVSKRIKTAYPQYSFEKLLSDDPEYLILPEGVVPEREIMGDARWQKLEAVKNSRILFIDADILSRPGPRVVEAVEEIALFIHEKKAQ